MKMKDSPRLMLSPLKSSASRFFLGALFGFSVSSSFFFLATIDLMASPSSKRSTFPLDKCQQQSRRGGYSVQHHHAMKTDGWKTLHVFAGDKNHSVDASTIPVDYYVTTRWFSQRRQDYIVSNILNGKRNGYFIDLASNDAIRISNTYALERDFGWKGLCIEPNPAYWSSLSYRECDVVAAVVGRKRMEEVAFNFHKKGPQSGIVGNDFRNKEPGALDKVQRRSTVTLQEIFERFGTPPIIDYMSLDVEGAEEFIMESFPFDKYRFNVLTIEQPRGKLVEILKENDYDHLKNVRRDESFWVHRSMLESINRSALDIDIPKYRERVRKP